MTILIQAWVVHKFNDTYFLPYTHWVYLNEIIKYYDKVTLIAPIKMNKNSISEGLLSISEWKSIEVIELPYATTYIRSIKYFRSYLKKYSSVGNFDVSYSRYPIPFGWLQKFYLKKTKRIIHFVGDPVDTTKSNPNFSRLKKFMLISLFMPEHMMYLWACKGAKIYTNGFHIAEKLKKSRINASSLISSTLNIEDFHKRENKGIDQSEPKILYVGYLRKAKGVETVLYAFKILKKKYPNAKLTIVGSGEFETQLKNITDENKITNVHFEGHVDQRNKLNQIFRSHDIFCFASLSEGSPRVILEAMANNINIVSTPVGALPYIFEDERDIIYARFNDPLDFSNKIDKLIQNPQLALKIRENSYLKAQENTISGFLKKIFYEA